MQTGGHIQAWGISHHKLHQRLSVCGILSPIFVIISFSQINGPAFFIFLQLLSISCQGYTFLVPPCQFSSMLLWNVLKEAHVFLHRIMQWWHCTIFYNRIPPPHLSFSWYFLLHYISTGEWHWSWAQKMKKWAIFWNWRLGIAQVSVRG